MGCGLKTDMPHRAAKPTCENKVSKMNLDLTDQKVSFSWKDILWGYENKYLGWADVAAYARKMTLSDHDERVFKLSLINKSNILEL